MTARAAPFDLLRVTGLRRFLRWRHARVAMQLPLLALALVIVVHGLTGPELAPKNLATLLVWVHYRGALVLALLLVGNLFCMGCPLLLPRDLLRRFVTPRFHWPRFARNKWLALALFVGVLFTYELFDLWGAPRATAWLIIAYFVGATLVDALFKGAAFCKYVCPVGQFNFVASTVSPFEFGVRDLAVCDGCSTKDCIKGSPEPPEGGVRSQRGCELALFLPLKEGNLDCTFCLDCVHACPEDNVVIAARLPAVELLTDVSRSGVGRIFRRTDLAALAAVFTFGAFLNAFGMVSPVYALESWLADLLGVTHEAPVLGLLFLFALVVLPALLLGGAGVLSLRLSRSSEALLPHVKRWVYSLVPLGFCLWVAHYCFHFLTGLWTVVPVTQHALVREGVTLFGKPDWGMGGFPASRVYPLELGFLALGFLGSVGLAWRLAAADFPARPARAFAPWGALAVLLLTGAIWLMSQPMEMRGTMLGG